MTKFSRTMAMLSMKRGRDVKGSDVVDPGPEVASRLASQRPEGQDHHAPILAAGQFLAAIYGAFFGAGLGVMTGWKLQALARPPSAAVVAARRRS